MPEIHGPHIADFERFSVLSGWPTDERPRAASLKAYADAAEVDLEAIFRAVLPLLFMAEAPPHSIDVRVDPYDLRFMAKVRQSGDGYTIVLSAGALLAIDDASSVYTRWVFPEASVAYDWLGTASAVDTRFLDYGYLLWDNLPEDAPRGLGYCCPVLFLGALEFEYRAVLANLAVIWLVLHELGHIQLGHFSDDEGRSHEYVDELGALFGEGAATPSLRASMEIAADGYAVSQLVGTFLRRDALDSVLSRVAPGPEDALHLLVSAISIPSSLLYRSQLSAMPGGFRSPGEYPGAMLRAFNCLAMVPPAVDHVREVVAPVMKRFGHDGQVILDGEEGVASAMVRSVDLIDRFLRYMKARPLLPWIRRLVVDLPHPGSELEFVDPGGQVLDEGRVDLVATIAAARRGSAGPIRNPELAALFDEWVEVVSHLYRFWEDEADRHAADYWGSIEAGDLHVGLTYLVFRDAAWNSLFVNGGGEAIFWRTRRLAETVLGGSGSAAEA